MKRLFDVLFALFILATLSPILFIIGVIIRIKLGSPIMFKQLRPGHYGKPFFMYKFRTMTGGLDSCGNLLPDAQRITVLGKLLRSTSLDEFPALWSVLKGDMSLVGPRPLLMEYLPLYSSKQALRHNALPGITGWAQVNGRNAISWDEKFRLDIWYVNNRSFWLDLKILLMTIRKVFLREGISANGEVTMPKFTGSGL